MIKKDKLEKSFIDCNASILDALKAINSSGIQIALILNENKILEGVITDGDIRRSLLKGYKLTDKINNIYNRNFFKISKEQVGKEAKDIMQANGLNALPVIDDDGKPIDILFSNLSESLNSSKSLSLWQAALAQD